MSDFVEAANAVLGLSSKAEDLGWAQACVRALVVYVALIIIVRFGKKRFLSRATAFDTVLVITIGSIASRGITANAPLLTTLVAVLVLVATHWVISYFSRDHPAFGRLVKGTDTLLVKDGQIDERALAQAHMSRDDLEEDLRQKGVAGPSKAKEARLERSGNLSVIKE
jgi:uncharacterized membrane protein YcaP (DUF421 family)